MPSSFKSLDLFGSGPHRFRELRRGQMVIPEFNLGLLSPGSIYLGPLELQVEVRGRLIAASESALWALRDDITAQLLDPPSPGTLIDLHGRAFADMSFIRFEPADRTDRGRDISLAYTALFIDFRTYPFGGIDA